MGWRTSISKKSTMTQSVSRHLEIARKIDHTLLRPTLTRTELEALCHEAAEWQFATVCIPPCWVRDAARLLVGTDVKTITVVGFPLGYSHPSIKALEARRAMDDGASEIDLVVNLSRIKSAEWAGVEADITETVRACAGVPVKVIIETAYLNQEEKSAAALAAERAGAAFVKTSTGFATGVPVTGATVEDIRLLRSILRPATKIKASGGIRDWAGAIALIEAGADRLGTSSGVAILQGLSASGAY
jgi:deoxyribose-phosphate aldolase